MSTGQGLNPFDMIRDILRAAGVPDWDQYDNLRIEGNGLGNGPRGDAVRIIQEHGNKRFQDGLEAGRKIAASSSWTCNHCGNEQCSEAAYCEFCGMSKQGAVPDPSRQPQTPRPGDDISVAGPQTII